MTERRHAPVAVARLAATGLSLNYLLGRGDAGSPFPSRKRKIDREFPGRRRRTGVSSCSRSSRTVPHRKGGEGAIKVGITGKTGSGKTTVSALVAMACAARGLRTLAVDTDVSPNLALSLGLDQATIDSARTVPRALVSGRGGGSIAPGQVVSGYGMETPSGVTLLHAMTSSDDVGGCTCPAHASARGLLASALDEADVAVLDMEAGLEHLDRPSGTVAHADILLVVMEPSRKSSVTAERMVVQAADHGVERVALVGNKATDEDLATFSDAAATFGISVAGVVPYDEGIVDADRSGAALTLGDAGPLRAGVDGILAALL